MIACAAMSEDLKRLDSSSDSALRLRAQGEKVEHVRRHPYYHLHRKISWQITKVAWRVGLSPRSITFSMLLFWVLAVLLASTTCSFAAPVFLYISFILDKSDGELARVKGTESKRAAYIDEVFHFFSIPAVILSQVTFDTPIQGLVLHLLGCFSFFFIKYERKVHYKYSSKLSTKISTLPEWFVQDDVLIMIFAISVWSERFDFVPVWCALLLTAGVWRVVASLGFDGLSRG